MRWARKVINPLIAFIGIQIVLGLMIILWVYWFTDRHRELKNLAARYRPETIPPADWVVLAEGIALLLFVLVGVYVIYLYWRRQSKLYGQQQALIAQITHELKSPLASIQLHLETIRLRKPAQEKLEWFLDTMLYDTERLNSTISKLLMAARLDQRWRPKTHQIIDLSKAITDMLETRRGKLPEGGSLRLVIEPQIKTTADLDDLEVVIGNLFENAMLYTTEPPDITVSLTRTGRRCILSFKDLGKGIAPEDLKRIFKRFQRSDNAMLNRRGTGLGLYIVKSIIAEHGGTITAHSDGEGAGAEFRISLPLA